LSALIVLNKVDLLEESRVALKRLAVYEQLGYPVVQISALGDVTALRHSLTGQRTVLVGQSGMGKSTLINALLPDARARVAEISVALDSGKHTTTHTHMYRLDESSALIDSPGLQEFGLAHVDQHSLEHGFREFGPYLGHCRFTNCVHMSEPGCAVTTATEVIHPERLRIYQKLVRELKISSIKY
jgi:ribosome biogenesis GTPase / thiamine phosphate phosphatase